MHIDSVSVMRLFSYGSNSLAQLCGRIQCDPAQTRQRSGRALNMQRIFAGTSSTWGGGIASLHRMEGASTAGSIVDLTSKQIDNLAAFERGYELERLSCIYEDTGEEVQAYAFIKDSFLFEKLPSEQYLTAIYHHLIEVGIEEALDIVGIQIDEVSSQPTIVQIQSGWTALPTLHQSLQAFLVSVNIQRFKMGLPSWEIPREFNDITDKLNKIGIFFTKELSVALHNTDHLNQCLNQNSFASFDQGTLDSMRALLMLQQEAGPDLPLSHETTLLFVYGSLLSSLHNHGLLEKHHANFKSTAVTSDEFYMCSHLPGLSFPYLTKEPVLPGQQRSVTVGEVYEVPLSAIPELDRLENHPTWYKRQFIPARLSSDQLNSQVQVYILESENDLSDIRENDHTYADVACGDWKAFLACNKSIHL